MAAKIVKEKKLCIRVKFDTEEEAIEMFEILKKYGEVQFIGRCECEVMLWDESKLGDIKRRLEKYNKLGKEAFL